jgi:hypothetical protein
LPISDEAYHTVRALYQEAHAGVFQEAAEWMVKKEGNAHVRAASKVSGDATAFGKWQDGFYEKHVGEMVRGFCAPADALAMLLATTARTNDDVKAVHKRLTATCEALCAEARKQYATAFGNLNIAEKRKDRENTAPAYIGQTVMEAVTEEVIGRL